MAAQRVDFRMERRRRAHRRIGRQRAGDQRRLRRAVGAEQAGQRQRGRDLRAVDQRQPFLGGEHDRLQPGLGEAVARRHALAVEEDLAFADHRRRHMRQRREIARRADRALFRDDRHDALRQHRLDQRDQFRAARRTRRGRARSSFSAMTSRTISRRKRRADAAAMRQDQVALQGRDVVGGDPDRWRVCRSRY